MTLKFDVAEDMGGYRLLVDTAQTNLEVGATEPELRRLLIDLLHEFDIEEGPYRCSSCNQRHDGGHECPNAPADTSMEGSE